MTRAKTPALRHRIILPPEAAEKPASTQEFRVVYTMPEGPVTVTIQYPAPLSVETWYDLCACLSDSREGSFKARFCDVAVPASEWAESGVGK